MATHSSIPAWRIPWSEELGWLQSMRLQRVRHNLVTKPPTTTTLGGKLNYFQVFATVKILKWIFLFSSVTQSCPTLCDLMDGSTPGLPVHHQLPELAQTHVHRVGDAIKPSHPLSSCSPLVSIFPSIRVFLFFASGGQIIGASGAASVLPMNVKTDFL